MLNDIIKEDFNTLIIITESILETYKALYLLDVSGKKETEEYKSLRNALNSSLTLENDIYSRFPEDEKVIDKLFQYFIDQKGNVKSSMEAILTTVLDNITSSLVSRRIYHKLINKYMTSVAPNETSIDILKIFPNSNQTIKSFINIYETQWIDFLNTFLVILNEYLNDDSFKDIHKQLWQVVYNSFFISSSLEGEGLDNNMSINPNLYWQDEAITNFYNLPKEEAYDLKLSIAGNIFDCSFKYLINEYPFKDNKPFSYLMAIIVFRTSSLFLGVSFEELMASFEPNEPLKEIIAKLHLKEMVDKDKSLPQIITGISRR